MMEPTHDCKLYLFVFVIVVNHVGFMDFKRYKHTFFLKLINCINLRLLLKKSD